MSETHIITLVSPLSCKMSVVLPFYKNCTCRRIIIARITLRLKRIEIAGSLHLISLNTLLISPKLNLSLVCYILLYDEHALRFLVTFPYLKVIGSPFIAAGDWFMVYADKICVVVVEIGLLVQKTFSTLHSNPTMFHTDNRVRTFIPSQIVYSALSW